jgi:hypothetical protein
LIICESHRKSAAAREAGRPQLSSAGFKTNKREDRMRSQALRHVMDAIVDIDDAGAGLAAKIRSLTAGLEGIADALLNPAHGADRIRTGVMSRLTAIELDPAEMAVETAARLKASGTETRSAALMLDLARKQLLVACAFASEVPVALPPAMETGERADSASPPCIVEQPPDLAILRNIASFHREHERYYTWHKANQAAELFREANRLKAIATTWLDDPLPASLAGNFEDPRFAATGCCDLNAMRAIGSIGILFMEGEQEPSEFLALKGKLNSMGAHSARSGKWLADKMVHAWTRESWLLRDEWIAAAEPRFGTIITNWRQVRHLELAARCATLALGIISSIDLGPAAIRRDVRGCGRRLLDAAWALDCAAQVTGRSAADLSENDSRWTQYLDLMAPIPEAEERHG